MDDIKLAAEGNKGLVAVGQYDVLHQGLCQKRCYMETKTALKSDLGKALHYLLE